MSRGYEWTNRRTEVVRAIASALRWAAAFSLLAIVQAVLSDGRALDRYGFTLPQVVAFYVGGALLVGLVVGLLKPLTQTLGGAMLVGVVAVLPLIIALTPIGAPQASWGWRLKTSLLLALIIGPVYAWALWERPSLRRRRRK